jgi:glycosyltransferase involved in cell wall biosynthesis
VEFNIVYFASVEQNYGGVEQKIISQFDALINQKSNVVLYLICSYPPKGIFALEIEKRTSVRVLLNALGNVKNPFFRRKEKFELISKTLKEYNPTNTIVYLRHPDADFILLSFLKLNKVYKIVTEHNEIENRFYSLRFNDGFWGKVLETIYGKKVRKRICAFVGVTKEITDFEIRESGVQGKKAITIGNGIDVHKYPLRILNKQHPEIIKLLFVGAGHRSHGLDRIIKGIAAYIQTGERPYNIMLRISGESREMDRSRALVKRLKINDHVEFLRYRNPEELNIHFNWADIGVGGLGFHRIGLKYTSNLKAREYFSRGLPFFLSSVDEDLDACSRYVHMVDAKESAINIPDIIRFALIVRSDMGHPQTMRSYAINHLDWSIKMKTLITFFESLLSS